VLAGGRGRRQLPDFEDDGVVGASSKAHGWCVPTMFRWSSGLTGGGSLNASCRREALGGRGSVHRHSIVANRRKKLGGDRLQRRRVAAWARAREAAVVQ
jgi:hypothetical protein